MDYYYHSYPKSIPVTTQLTHKLLSLRKFEQSDVDDLMIWASDERVTHYCWLDTFTNKQQAIEYINSNINHPFLRAICLNNRAIGAISVTFNSGNNNDLYRAELGYVLAAACWGMGIATWAVEVVSSRIFDEWPQLERLEAMVDVENLASIRVLEKVGFRREGLLRRYVKMKGVVRDVVMFSLVSTDRRGSGSGSGMAPVSQSAQLCKSLGSLNIS